MIAAPLMNEADCLARQLRTKTPPQRTTTAAPERLPRERLSPLAELGRTRTAAIRRSEANGWFSATRSEARGPAVDPEQPVDVVNWSA
jgi:hypothetical protein